VTNDLFPFITGSVNPFVIRIEGTVTRSLFDKNFETWNPTPQKSTHVELLFESSEHVCFFFEVFVGDTRRRERRRLFQSDYSKYIIFEKF
jgi:hypothetical protein